MTIKNIQIGQAGLSGTLPQWIYVNTTDTLATVTTTGYLNGAAHEFVASLTNYMMAEVTIIPSANALPEVLLMQVIGVNGVWSLVQPYVLNNPVSGQVVTVNTTAATAGTLRAFTGKIVETATVMTSGTLTGVRGELDVVGASAGFLYGSQGKVIPTGTLSGSSWTAGVFGQFDLTNATINAGQTAPVWADYGASGGTFTNVTGMRMFSGTNTISTLTLFAMDYRYGKATNMWELDGSSSTYITAASTGGLSGTIKKIALSIDGVTYYMPVATVVS